MYKLIVFVPKASLEGVKEAIFCTGAGSTCNYVDCSWQSDGLGQFKPVGGANPGIGTLGCLETVLEVRLEILCSKSNVRKAVWAMRDAHPYEEPAFEIIELVNVDSL